MPDSSSRRASPSVKSPKRWGRLRGRQSVGDTRPRGWPGGRSSVSLSNSGPQPAGLLQRGAEAYGFGGQVWSRARIAAVIWLICGVAYRPPHVEPFCHAIDWSPL
jgi:hypothetical protein